MNPRIIAASAVLVAGAAGCAPTGSSTGSTAPVSAPSTDLAAAPSPAQQYCTTKACIAQDLDKGLVGVVAKDESVMVKAACKASTVKAHPDQVYSARCTITYSDGNVATGTGNVLLSQGEVTFTPDGA